MKLLILVAVIAAVVWLVRGLNKPAIPPANKREPDRKEEMVACAHCGVHLPRSEALPGRGGVFCGPEHRSAFEREQGD